MALEHTESFQNGRVALSVYQSLNPLQNTYWLKAGAAEMEFKEDDLVNLYQILDAYYEKTTVHIRKSSAVPFSHLSIFIMWVSLMAILLIRGA